MFKKDTCKCKGSNFIEIGSWEDLALFQSVSKVETFRGNYEGFTKKDVGKSILDRKAQAMIGIPSDKYFKEPVIKN